MAQEHQALARRERAEMPLEPRARALEPLRHPQLERDRGLGRDGLGHQAEHARRERQEQRRLDHVLVREREDARDVDAALAVEHRDQRAEEALHVALVQREQEFLLAREVEVDGALRESRLVGDLGDARNALGRAQQEPLCRVEQRLVALFLVFGLDGPLPDCHDIRPVFVARPVAGLN